MSQIIITKPRVLNAADKASLRKAGVVVIEAADPGEVRFIEAEREVAPSAMLYAALRGLKHADSMRGDHLFVTLLTEFADQALADKLTPPKAQK